MAVRFVIGRAGTGKTHHCIASIQERLHSDPVDGPRLILLVPEQAGLQMERALLETPRDGVAIAASHRAEVLSFRRMALRVLESVGVPVGTALTESARAMVLRHLCVRCSDDLAYYGRMARAGRSSGRLSGFIQRLGATINELIEEAVEPEELMGLQPGEPGDSHSGASAKDAVQTDPAQRAKLHDIALLYAAYRDYLGTTRLDPSQYLQVARAVLGQCAWLHGAEVWVDGFASFSGQERLTLIELARLAARVEITALFDPCLVDSTPGVAASSAKDTKDRESTATQLAAARLFARVHRTYADLSRGLTASGLSIDPPLLLTPDPPPRFASAPVLADVERALFILPGDQNQRSESTKAAVEVVELPDRRSEVDYAVSRLVQWVQSPADAYRYRDLAIIVRDLDLYHDAIADALRSRGIPFFIDRRRSVAHHPLVELLRLAPTLAVDSLALDSVRLLLKTDLVPLSREDADELENYLIAHGIHGVEAWRDAPWRYRTSSSFAGQNEEPDKADVARLDRVNIARARVLDLLEPWLRFAIQQPAPTGAAWSRALIQLIERFDVGTTLKTWYDTAIADGDLDQAEEHQQLWTDVLSLIDDLSFALADAPLTVTELGEVLDAGLSGLTLGLVPPTVDQVLVGSIERSRHPAIKAAVIVGCNDGVFPQRPTEDAILNDDDRVFLADSGVRIGPPARERVADESMLFYIALTRTRASVVVTYAGADQDGRPLRPSPFLTTLREACPALTPKAIGNSRRQRTTWDVLCTGDLRERVIHDMRTRPDRHRDDAVVRARWNELYATARQILRNDEVWRRARLSLVEKNDATLSPALIERALGVPLRTSISRLETFAACPFQHFARYTLDLRERAHARLEPVDMGQVHHSILEEFIRSAAAQEGGFHAMSDEELLDKLSESCERVAAHLPDDARVSDARNAYVLRRSARQLARVLAAQRATGSAGRARPRRAELAFGMNQPGSLPALAVDTPKGRRVLLRGYVDRVDIAELSDEWLGVVIDYKRTREKRLDLSRVYNGLSLQLIAYLLVLAEHGKTLAGRPIRPVAAFFVPLRSRYHLVDGPDDKTSIERIAREAHRPRGLIRFEDLEALDAAVEKGKRSEHYVVHRTQADKLGYVNQSDGAVARDFDAVLEHTRNKLGSLADGVLDGDVSVTPYRLGNFSPCSWCAMMSVCRFEWGMSTPRFIEPMARSDVFDLLAQDG